MRETTRHLLIAATTLALVTPAAAVGGIWETAQTETQNDLHDVDASLYGQFAVGGDGIVLERTEAGWTTVTDGGPSGNGNNLYGSDVTDDGEAFWFVGASGAVGELDVQTGVIDDHSAPLDQTDQFNSVAATGDAGEANVYIATDSGQIYYSFDDGKEGTWDYVEPGSGSTISAIDCHDARSCHAVDTNGKVFATDDGQIWNAIGIPDADVNFYGVDSNAADDVWVAGGNGLVFHYDGANWTTTDLGDANLRAVEIDTLEGFAVGNNGKVFHYESGTWHAEATPSSQDLHGLTTGAPSVVDTVSAAGASGTLLERSP